MGFIDIVLGALLAYGLYKGLKNGVFVELASLISFFIGIYIAVKFSSFVATIIGGENPSKTMKVGAFIITFIVVVFAVHYLAKIFSGMASWAYLGWLNKLGGAFFAVLKTTLLLGVVLSLFLKININDSLISKKTQEESLFFNPVLKTSEILLPVVTNWFADLKNKTLSNDTVTDETAQEK